MNVLEKMVKNKRLPVLFIGSGIPKRYLKNFPSWDELLNESFSKVNSDPFYIGRYKEKFKREGLSNFDQYKELGTLSKVISTKHFIIEKFHLVKQKIQVGQKEGFLHTKCI